mgnify:CR=1 FL=1
MPEMVYEAARRAAADLLRRHWDGHLPIRLSEISASLNASKYEADLGGTLSGMVSKTPGSGPRIALNSRHSSARRRFTWAHELGHVVERKQLADDPEYSFTDARGAKYDLHEFFADEFAGSLLIPADELRRLRNLGYTTGQLARTFGVSVDAIDKRIARLEVHPDELAHA